MAQNQNPGGGNFRTQSSVPASTTPEQKGNGKIIGAVIDAGNNQPVEFANVALMDPKTGKPVDGTVCDDKGKFVIPKVASGTYHITISFIGYESFTIENVVVSDKKSEINLGTIKLKDSAKMLGEVTVEAEKNLIEERVDRTIYNAENDQTARGGDATDVLKRVPMLSVDLEGNVSMRGSQNIQVLINNKPSTIMAANIADALKQIPADQIKSVEVITSPSAKYDAEGSAGIINIITKKNTLQGLTLNIDAGVGNRGANLGLNGNYRQKKMGFSLGGFGRANYNINGRFENEQRTFSSLSDQFPTVNLQQADTRNRGLFGNYTLGWDYDINEKNSLVASARFGARNGNNFQDNLLTQISDENGSSTTLRNVETNNLNNSVDLSLTYTHLYEKPQREFSILGNFSRNNGNNDFENLISQVDGVNSPSGFKNLNDSYNQEMTLQVDYQTPIQDNQMVEFGAKDIMRKVFSDFSYFSDPEGDGSYVLSNNSSLTNNLNYDQNIVAGYLSYTYTSKNAYSIKAGGRYEYTTINAYTQTEANIDIPEYGAFVPSINISKKLKSGKTIKAAYNRRIQRPSIRFLNPNVQASNPYDVTFGNPNLDPEYSNNFEVSYSTFVKGTSINFSTFWRNTNNGIQSIRTVEITPDDIQRVTTTYDNIGQEDAVGINVFANVSLGKLMLNGGADVYYSMLNNNLPVDANNPEDPNRQYSASNEGWVASGRMFGSYNLNKGWGFQFFGFYRGRQIQLQGTQGGMGIYSLGLRKDFNNKKGSIGLGAENFFATEMKIKSNVTSPLVNRESLNVMRNMGFRLNVSYRIGKMSMDARPKRRRSINNDDLKDGGGDGGGMDMSSGQTQQRSSGSMPAITAGAAAKVADVKLPASDPEAVVKAEGKWTYTIESPQGSNGGTITLTKEGETFSGVIFNTRMNKETPLSSVTLNGNELTFSYDADMRGNVMKIEVKVVIKEDAFSGTMSIGQFGAFPITAQREKE
ncbi:MAG: TonB-dependent receptor [Cyclobacteriaceae bacterium]|nr:TonB-dependent receptor [Cyclobacteriaceae bacterium]